VNYSEVVQALTIFGLARGDQAALAAADRVLAFWQSGGSSAK